MSEAEDASGKVSNLTAVEAISARLAEVTRLAEKLDARLCEAGARTRPVPMSSSAMSSTSSLFSTSSNPATAATSISSHSQPISTGTSTFGTTVVSTTPSISSSTSTVQLQPKSISTVLSSATMAAKGATAWNSSSVPVTETSTPSATTNGTICTNDSVDRVLSPVLETSATMEKEAAKHTRANGSETRGDSGFDRVVGDEGEEADEEAAEEEVIERSFDDSLADDSNMEGYVTATECSVTPTGRSRSESFVTSPECEDLAAPATVTSACDTWWNIEDPKFTATSEELPSSVIKQEEAAWVPKTEERDSLTNACKPELRERNEEKQVEKLVLLEKRVEENSGKIVKEVTETTTLRVSHDTRLGIASYKVISNTLQGHQENVDVKEIRDLERIVSPDDHGKTNGLHRETELGSKTDSYSRRDELSTKTDDTDRVIKFTKVCEMSEGKPRVTGLDTSKDITLSLKEYTRHHEDSGIEMSPTKKEESLEGQDFLERARKVSPVEASPLNGQRNKCCCSCNCSHEAACFERYAVQPNFIDFTSINESRHRLPLSNTS